MAKPDKAPERIKPVPIKELLGEAIAEEIASHSKKDVNDIYFVPPSLQDFLFISQDPQRMLDPARVLHAVIKTDDRKRVIDTDKVNQEDGQIYQEAYAHAVKYFNDFALRHEGISKKILPPPEKQA